MKYAAIDSHCHLQLAAYDLDREAVMRKCRDSGIGVIIVGTNKETSTAAVRLAESHPDGVWASIAVHPGHVHAPHHDPQEMASAPKEEFFDEEYFAALADSPKVVAIGETGLDYYRLAEPPGNPVASIKKHQQENFLRHIAFAKKRGLPLILHVRDNGGGEAYDDTLAILEQEKYFNGVMHCFGGNVDIAKKCAGLGLYLGIGGIITYPPRKGQSGNPLIEVARTLPLDKLLLETDAPYISPAPLRGERNEPVNVLITGEKMAMIRADSVENILSATANNAVRLFNLASSQKP